MAAERTGKAVYHRLCYNSAMISSSLVARFLAFANELRFKNLFFIVLGLLFADLLIPDLIPFFDEIILGLAAILLANWKQERKLRNDPDNIIEGEIVDEGEDKEK